MGGYLKIAHKIKHLLQVYYSENRRMWEGIVLYAVISYLDKSGNNFINHSQIQYTGWYWWYLHYFLHRTCVLYSNALERPTHIICYKNEVFKYMDLHCELQPLYYSSVSNVPRQQGSVYPWDLLAM